MASLEFLRNWAVEYFRHRDSSISKVEITELGFTAVRNNGTSMMACVSLSLSSIDQNLLRKAEAIVTLNNEENLKLAHRMWDKLASNKALLLVFANPFSQVEQKWLLKPHIHDKICDKAALFQGLKGMAELVEPIDESGFLSASASF